MALACTAIACVRTTSSTTPRETSGDSSDEEADEDDANERRRRRKVTPAAKSQSSDAPAAPPTPEPFAPQARAFMEEKGLDTWETEETTVILECCTEAYKRRLH